MAKKLGKILLAAAAVASAAAAAWYLLRRKNECKESCTGHEDKDASPKDIPSDLNEGAARSYVSLDKETAETTDAAKTPDTAEAADAAAIAGTAEAADPIQDVEEFFDEEDAPLSSGQPTL